MVTLLWKPSEARIQGSNLRRFLAFVNDRNRQNFTDYDGLHEWSVNHIADFWAALWEFVGIRTSCGYERVIDDERKMPGAKWFSGARLNFAENLLRLRDDSVALIFKGEDRPPRKMTYAGLYDEVAGLAKSLRDMGVVPGDRVAGFLPNLPETVAAMLAATSLGAVWSSCSPDFGSKGVLDRLGQIQPKVLFAADGYFFIRAVPLRPSALYHVHLGDNRPAQMSGPERRRNSAQPPQGIDPPYEPLPGGHHLLFYDLRLDDVELAGQLTGRGGEAPALRRQPFLSGSGRPVADRAG